MYDLIIRNGKVVDGAGNPWFKTDVGVHDGKIEMLGDLSSVETERVLDATGLVVCPGFIDIHAHYLDQLLVAPTADAKIHQGITTMLGGNCGDSVAPLKGFRRDASFFDTGIFKDGRAPDWSTFEDFFVKLEKGGIAINVASLVGNGAVRACVLGRANKKPSGGELQQMKALVAEAMEHGAMGLSTGLIYPPSGYADTHEVVELCRVVAEYGGFYATHVRGMGHTLIEAVAEGLEIGRQADLPVQISHLEAGPPSHGRVPEVVGMIESARAGGFDVTTDNLVWELGMFYGRYLLPLWANEGGLENLLKRLQDPETRERIKADTRKYGDSRGGSVNACLIQRGDWDKLWITRPERLKGKTIANLTELRGGGDPYDTLLDLLVEEKGDIVGGSAPYLRDDIDYMIKQPLSMLATDCAPSYHGGVMEMETIGSFGKVFGKDVRERGLIRLEEAVRRSTSYPAQRMGLKDRGLLKEGFVADITIFNPETVSYKGTLECPDQYPEGFEWVIVNGQVVLDRGEHTGALPGRVLRYKK